MHSHRRPRGIGGILTAVAIAVATGTMAGACTFPSGAGLDSVPAAGKNPYKGIAGAPCAELSKLNVSWHYNWAINPGDCTTPGFIPTVSRKPDITAGDVTWNVDRATEAGYTTLLGFNEPDRPDQSNLTVAKVLDLWPALTANPSIRAGSPSPSSGGQAWFTDFMTKAADRNLRIDFMNLHWYGWHEGSCDPAAANFDAYLKWAESLPGNRPIWITEWGCLNKSAPDRATVERFYAGAIAMLAKHPRVERQAFYPHIPHHELMEADGTPTPLGKAFIDTPATR